MKNKRGWIKILEAFIALVLITLALVILISGDYFKTGEDSDKIYRTQILILREIQLDNSLRESILSIESSNLPAYWNGNFPADVQTKITENIPNYLNCEAAICSAADDCEFQGTINDRSLYVESTKITASLIQGFNPRQLKLFCWIK